MEIYLLGNIIAFSLTIIIILIEKALLRKLSQAERLHYESKENKFAGSATFKDALANAALSWIGVVLVSLTFIMFLVSLFAIKK